MLTTFLLGAIASTALAAPTPRPQIDLGFLSPLIGGGSQDPMTALTQIGSSLFGNSTSNPITLLTGLLSGGGNGSSGLGALAGLLGGLSGGSNGGTDPLGAIAGLLGSGGSGGGGLGSLLGLLGSSGGSSSGSGGNPLGALAGLLGGGGSSGGADALGALAGLFGGATSTAPPPASSSNSSSPVPAAPGSSAAGGLGDLASLLGGSSGGSGGLGALAGLLGGSSGGSGGLGALAGLLGGSGGPSLLSSIMDGKWDTSTLWAIIKSFPGPDLRAFQAIFEIPNIEKHITSYLDMRNISAVPFIGAIPNGPAPHECSKHELIIARGTGEVGQYGFIVGDPLLEHVQKLLPGVQGYSVQYPADIDANSWQIGVKDVVNRLNSQSKKCPETKFALAGYSQGAMIMHMAINHNETSPSVLREKVVGGAMFGDPYRSGGTMFRLLLLPGTAMSIPKFPALLDAKIKSNCAVTWETTDPMCNDGDSMSINLVPHLTYNNKGTMYMKDSAEHLVKLFKEKKMRKRAVRKHF